MNKSRLSAIRALLAAKGLDAVVISKYVNLHYSLEIEFQKKLN